MTTPRDVLDFWFGAPDAPHFGASRPEWFVKDDDFDTAIRARFGAAVDLALRGGLEDWPADFAGALALVILLDQFPRNIYRGSAKMFDGDVRARAVASQALELAAITSATPQQRMFLYLPFEHSEERRDQALSVHLFDSMPDSPDKENWIDYALKHKAIVDRFGRFPHRNDILGRSSTPEEIEFLKGPDSGF